MIEYCYYLFFRKLPRFPVVRSVWKLPGTSRWKTLPQKGARYLPSSESWRIEI